MSTTIYLHQPFTGQLGGKISEICEGTEYTSLTMAVAFAKVSGVLRLKKSLEAFIRNGGAIDAIVGIDLGGTSYEALVALFEICSNLYVAHVDSTQTFHPKIYAFKNEDALLAIVGSNNLTGGGLWTNMESCSITDLRKNNAEDVIAISQIDEYFYSIASGEQPIAKRVSSQDFLDALLQAGLIEREMTTKIKRAKERKEKKGSQATQSSLQYFFEKSVPATLPKLQPTASDRPTESIAVDAFMEMYGDGKTDITVLTPEKHADYQTLWFETRRLTGGSRNILDLSMRARIEKGNPRGTEYDLGETNAMGGGVMFFGVNPESTESLDVTINYNGVDYMGNTVKFPKGDRANGTWRLQIKGVSKAGQKITDAFERGYLVQKILVFERIQPDYFTMTVFPDSDLQDFQDASEIVARNGVSTQAKLFGLL